MSSKLYFGGKRRKEVRSTLLFSIYLRTFNPLFTLQELIITDVYNSFSHETTQVLELATGIQQCVTVFRLFYATLLNSVMKKKKKKKTFA